MLASILNIKLAWIVSLQLCRGNDRWSGRSAHAFPLITEAFPWIVLAVLAVLAVQAPATEPVQDAVFAAVDVETTGFNPESDRIVEIAVVRFQGSNVLARGGWLVNPGISIPPAVTAVHGISNAMVSNAVPFAAVFPHVIQMVSNAVVVAHNSRFDISFITAEAQRAGFEKPAWPVLDSLALAKVCFPGADSHRLEAVAGYAGVAADSRHRAGTDAEMLRKVFLHCQMKVGGNLTFEQLQAMLK